MKNRTLTFLIAVPLLCSCTNKEQRRYDLNAAFLSKYRNYKFDDFKNHTVFVRSYDGRDPIIMIIDKRIDTGDCKLPFTIIVNQENNTVKKIKGNWVDTFGRCAVDTSQMVKLAMKLTKLGSSYINVDSNGIVFVQNVYGEGTPDLMRFSSPMFVTKDYKDNWLYKGNGWYERIKF